MTNITQQVKTNLHKKLVDEEKAILDRIAELHVDDPFTNPDHVSDNAAVDTDVREQVGHDTIEAQIVSLKKRLENIHGAVKKITTSGYGVCENCQKEIPVARLELVPEAKYCVDCEGQFVQ